MGITLKRTSMAGIFVTAAFLILGSGSVLAQQIDPILQPCSDPRSSGATVCEDGENVQGKDKKSRFDDNNPLFGKEGVITKFISTLSLVLGIIAVITIIAAGFRFIVSGSNPQEVNIAREMILYSCIALILAAMAQAIVQFWLNRIL